MSFKLNVKKKCKFMHYTGFKMRRADLMNHSVHYIHHGWKCNVRRGNRKRLISIFITYIYLIYIYHNSFNEQNKVIIIGTMYAVWTKMFMTFSYVTWPIGIDRESIYFLNVGYTCIHYILRKCDTRLDRLKLCLPEKSNRGLDRGHCITLN